MSMNSAYRMVCVGVLVLVFSVGQALAQSNPRFIQFKPRATKGALYLPDKGPAPHVAILVMHRTNNFMTHSSATKELPKRGFMVLGMNPRFDNNEAKVNWEDIALDVRQGVEFLKKQPGITKVILFGHSGGGPTMTYYQALAENGVGYCSGKGKLSKCRDKHAGGPPGDGIILVDAHPGNTINRLRSFNPAVINEDNAGKLDPSLDPFNPKNGYNKKGNSTYSEAFRKKYFKAQADRMNRLIAKAQKIKKLMKEGKYFPADNAAFIVHRRRARLMELDTSIHGQTEKPRKLLKNDGTIDGTKVVKSVRLPRPKNAKRDQSFRRATVNITVRSFLSSTAIRSTNSMDGIDWCSSNNSTPCALQQISVPLLIGAMGAHYFIRDNEIHYELAKSKDKDFIVVEGATHGIEPCKKCSKVTGKSYNNARKNFYDYVANWINKRY